MRFMKPNTSKHVVILLVVVLVIATGVWAFRDIRLASFQRQAQVAHFLWLTNVGQAISKYRLSHGGEFPPELETIVRPPAHAKQFGSASTKSDMTYMYTARKGIVHSTNGLILVLCDYPRLAIAVALLEDGQLLYVDEQIVEECSRSD